MKELDNVIMDIQTKIFHKAKAEERYPEEIFIEKMCNDLEDALMISGPELSSFEGHGTKISAWCYEGEEILSIIIANYKNRQSTEELSEKEIQQTFKRAYTFVKRGMSSRLYKEIEESSPGWKLAYLLHSARAKIKDIKFHLITDAVCARSDFPTKEEDGIFYYYFTWDMRDHDSLKKTGKSGAISIDFQREYPDYDLRCIKIDSDSIYSTYLAFVPGEMLAKMYERWGTKLLDLNVRVFLQSRSKINKGIQRTIVEESDMFLAYNNGITVFSNEVGLVRKRGYDVIDKVSDFQIVNGGQTTASLYYAWKNLGADLSSIHVQMKLTSISDSKEIDKFATKISEYSNTQNRVQLADFKARYKPHPQLQDRSKKIWAPDVKGGDDRTHWFYECKRGDYNEARNKNRTYTEKKRFDSIFPSSQKFDKIDLARWQNTWRIRPWMVSKGAQLNFIDFHEFTTMNDMAVITNYDEYFKRSVSLGLLWKVTDKLIRNMDYEGYKLNIVTYSLAFLYHKTDHRIDIDRIWVEQEVSKPILDALKTISNIIYKHITKTDKNVTEWCKKELCWLKMRDKKFLIPESLEQVLVPKGKKSEFLGGMKTEARKAVQFCISKSSETWKVLSEWGRRTQHLTPTQNSMCNTMSKFRRQKRKPSEVLSLPCKVAWDSAVECGWNPEE